MRNEWNIVRLAFALAIVMWSGSGASGGELPRWAALGSGLESGTEEWGAVGYALCVYQGDLIVGGDFVSAGGVPANGIARWDGQAWSALGNFSGGVHALGEYDGDLIAAGNIYAGEAVVAQSIARWDGTAWHSLGTGLYGYVLSLCTAGQNLYAAGRVSLSSDGPSHYVARWDGASWQAMGQVATEQFGGAYARTIIRHNGTLVIGGRMRSLGHLAYWDGIDWRTLAGGLEPLRSEVYALLVRDNKLWVGGDFPFGGPLAFESRNLVRLVWPQGGGLQNGVWESVEPYDTGGNVRTLLAAPGGVVGAGEFISVYSFSLVGSIALWAHEGVRQFGTGVGTYGEIWAITEYRGGIVATGHFDRVAGEGWNFEGGITANNIAVWNCVPRCTADVDCNGRVDGDDVYVFLEAWFEEYNDIPPGSIAEVDGSSWVDATDLFFFLDLWFRQVGGGC